MEICGAFISPIGWISMMLRIDIVLRVRRDGLSCRSYKRRTRFARRRRGWNKDVTWRWGRHAFAPVIAMTVKMHAAMMELLRVRSLVAA